MRSSPPRPSALVVAGCFVGAAGWAGATACAPSADPKSADAPVEVSIPPSVSAAPFEDPPGVSGSNEPPTERRRPEPRRPVPGMQPPDTSAQAQAQAAFQEGRRLLMAGSMLEACAKFEESNNLAPALGTLLNLAVCEEKAGRRDRACRFAAEATYRAAGTGDMRERVARDLGTRLGCPP